MPERTQKVSQYVLTKPLPCKPGQKLNLKMCWPDHSHASEDRTRSPTGVTKQIICQRGHKIYLKMCLPNPSHVGEHKKYLNLCWPNPSHKMQLNMCWPNLSYVSKDKIHLDICSPNTSMPARTKNSSQHVLNNSLICQRGHKLNLNMCWTNPANTNKGTKCISPWFDKNPQMPARTQNSSQHVLNKTLKCQRGHKMYLNLCWP